MIRKVLAEAASADKLITEAIISAKSSHLHFDVEINGEGVAVTGSASEGMKQLAKGTSFKGISDFFNKFEKERSVNNTTVDVYCLIACEGRKVRLARFDLTCPIRIDDEGKVVFDIVEKTLSPAEIDAVTDVRIGMYDEVKDVIYPFTKASLAYIGRYMDAGSAFKNMPATPFGSAWLIAERFAGQEKPVKLICKDLSAGVKPVLSLGAKKAECGTYETLIKRFFDAANAYGMYTVDSWKITGESAEVKIAFSEGYNIMFSTGNITGISNVITFEVSGVPVVTQTGYKTKSYDLEGSLEAAVKTGLPIAERAAKCKPKYLTEDDARVIKFVMGKTYTLPTTQVSPQMLADYVGNISDRKTAKAWGKAFAEIVKEWPVL